MPRPRARSLFELAGHWVAEIPRRKGLYAFWTNARDGGTCRRSLGTEDLEQAKLKLAEIVLKGAPSTATTPLAIIMENYFTARTDHLPSKNAARTAGRRFLEHFGVKARACDLTEDGLKGYARTQVKTGNSLGYIARDFTVASAALRHSNVSTIRVIYSESHMRNVWKLTAKARRKAFVPTDQQMALILRQPMPEDLSRWLLISMATGCRPEAAIDLAPAARIPEAQAIDLNPHGRAQNKKRRPIVRCPKVLTTALNRWEKGVHSKHTLGGRYCGYASVDSVDSALERVCKKIGIPQMSVYSIRHKVTTVMRAAGVPKDQIERQLGHRGTETSTSDQYGEFSPDFQKAASDALDAWVRRLRQLEIATKSHKISGSKKRAA